MTRGLVLGKFLPPHAGHLFLVEFAQRMCTELTVVVGTLRREPIAGELRHRWMCELCPGARVLHLTDENPQHPEEHPDFWNIWRRSLLGLLETPPDVVFASEAYGARLAEELGARFVMVDAGRVAVDVSGTRVRQAPFAHWELLPPCVRAHYALRVSVFGPESTGKTTLARRLADHYRTRWVPEFARTHLLQRDGALRAEDLPHIARGQRASEDALARAARKLLFCDTDPLATEIWSDVMFQAVDPEVTRLAQSSHYDLTLLLDADVPWVADPVRYLPHQGREFFERCRHALEGAGRRTTLVNGDFEARFEAACRAVDELIEERGVVQ